MKLDAAIVMNVDENDPDPPVTAEVDLLVRSLTLKSGKTIDMWHCTRCGGHLVARGMSGQASSMKYPGFNDHFICPDV